MFLDASALVAIIGDEPPAAALLAKIEKHEGPLFFSSLVVFETVVALARKHKIRSLGENVPTPPHLIAQIQDIVAAFLDEIGAVCVPIAADAHGAALRVAQLYGRATGHPAKLNFGDCFAYATAKALNVPLLFVGEDFARTDITPA